MGEGHLVGQLAGPEPGKLLDVIGGTRVAVGSDEPRQPEHEVVLVRLEVRPEPLDRLDLEARLLTDLAPEAGERLFTLLEKPARKVPVAAAGLDRALRQEHLAVALEQPLDAGGGVRVVDGAARGATRSALLALETGRATGTHLPAVEDAHRLDATAQREKTG